MKQRRGLSFALGALGVAALAIGAPEARASEGQAPSIMNVQFRFPWEAQRRPAKKPKRAAKPQQAKPAQDRAKPAPQAAPKSAKNPAPGKRSPASATLPELKRPPGLLPFAGAPDVEAGWSALAGQAPQPEPVPLLAPEGPAPAPASVIALLHVEPAREERTDEVERDDVPLPPRRPAAEIPPTGEPATAATPLPPEKPDDMKSAALIPKAPLPTAPAEPTPPDMPLPQVAWEDDPDCLALEKNEAAVYEKLPPIEGPGVCGAGPIVTLSGVKRRGGGEIAIKPAATLRCGMARTVVAWLRDDLAPAASIAGATLDRLDAAGSYSCRGRNNVVGAKMSEHARANALDVAGFSMADGKTYAVYDKDMPETFAAVLRGSACGRFNTVLGEGSDAAHATHLHVDLQPRKNRRGKLCQWEGDEDATPAKDEPAGDAK